MAIAGGPLSGVKVIELAAWHTGPMAATMLGDLGADVIKVEPARGDDYRQGGTSRGGFSAAFMAANRNKRSICLDLKNPEDLSRLKAMIGKSDVFIQNQRPGVVERMGLGAGQLRAEFPHLVHASISGFGKDGPKAGERGFDHLAQAMSGLASLHPDETGRPQAIRTLVADKLTSPMVAQAICAALFQQARTGQGCTIEYAMLDGMIWWNWPDMMANYTFIGDGVTAGLDVSEADFVCPTLDGHVIVSPHLDSAWGKLVELAERPDLRDDPRFQTMDGRMRHLREFSAAARECLVGKTSAEWCRLLADADIPYAPVHTVAQAIEDPQVRWNGIIEEVEHPGAGLHRAPRSAVSFNGHRNGTWRHTPELGEHTEEVLREFEAIPAATKPTIG